MPQIGEIQTRKKHKYIWTACVDCGKERWVFAIGGKPSFDHCQQCEGKRRLEDKHPNWKGGRRAHSQGYTLVRLCSDDFFYPMTNSQHLVFEHRLVVAKALGRCLHLWEIVHHKHAKYPAGSIEDKQDNRYPENLQLVTEDRHTQITLLERKIAFLRDKVEKLELENKKLMTIKATELAREEANG